MGYFLLCVFFIVPQQVLATNTSSNKPIIKRIGTVTLFVKKYGDMEMQLDDALATNNTNVIQKLLAKNFEERKSINPNSPIPKEDWINAKIKLASDNYRQIQQMAVRELDNVYIVSYLAIMKNASQPTMVVDIWKNSGPGTDSQLMARYSY